MEMAEIDVPSANELTIDQINPSLTFSLKIKRPFRAFII